MFSAGHVRKWGRNVCVFVQDTWINHHTTLDNVQQMVLNAQKRGEQSCRFGLSSKSKDLIDYLKLMGYVVTVLDTASDGTTYLNVSWKEERDTHAG